MAKARRSLVMLLAAVALLLLAPPALADGRGHTVLGQQYTLAAGERLNGDLVVLGGSARLRPGSVVDGNVTAMGGETVIEGRVRGDVVAVGGTVELGADAEIEGDMVAFGTVRRHGDAIVRGDLITGPVAARRFDALSRMFSGSMSPASPPAAASRPAEDWSWLGTIARQILTLGTALAAAALASMLFPANLARITEAMRVAWLQSAGVGALTGVVALVLAPVLAITCIGLPISVVLLVALGVSVLLGGSGAGQLLGARMARVANLRIASPLAETMLGVGIITLAAMLPCLGLLVALPVAAWGLGAVALTRFGTRTFVPSPLPSTPVGGAPAAPRGDTRPLEPPPGESEGQDA